MRRNILRRERWNIGRSAGNAGSDFIWLLSFLSSQRQRLILSLLLIILEGLISAIDPLLMRALIDRALPSHQVNLSLILVIAIGLSYIGTIGIFGAGALVRFATAQQCIRSLRIALFQQMTRLSENYHLQAPIGEKLTRIERDVDEIAHLGTDAATQSIRVSWLLILNLAIMAKLSYSMTLVALPFVVVAAVIQRRFSSLLAARGDKVRNEVGCASSLLNEYLTAVPQIQFLGAEHIATEQAISVWDGMLHAQWKERKTQIGFLLWMNTNIALGIILVLGLGSVGVFRGALTLGGLVAFYAYITRIFDPLNLGMDLYSRLKSVGANVNRVRNILMEKPTVKDCGKLEMTTGKSAPEIILKQVSFSYHPKRILCNLMLQINPAEHIAIIGPSGSGKSTLARLLVRAFDADSGTIFLGGNPINSYALSALRKAICYIPQQPILFQGTIRDNLLYANPQASRRELDRALAVAQLTQLLAKLPRGLDTPLGPGAMQLSGGERQRLAIARSILRNSPVLILDEATSALDTATESAVLTELSTIYVGHTLILISHRINSLIWVDRFVLLNEGRIVGIGKHETLYSQSSVYRSLFDISEQQAGTNISL